MSAMSIITIFLGEVLFRNQNLIMQLYKNFTRIFNQAQSLVELFQTQTVVN